MPLNHTKSNPSQCVRCETQPQHHCQEYHDGSQKTQNRGGIEKKGTYGIKKGCWKICVVYKVQYVRGDGMEVSYNMKNQQYTKV